MIIRYIFQTIFCIFLGLFAVSSAQAATITSAQPHINQKTALLELHFKSKQPFKLNFYQNKNSVYLSFPLSQFEGNMLNLLSLKEQSISFLPKCQNITVSQTLPSGKKGLYLAFHFQGQIQAHLKTLSPFQQIVMIGTGKSWNGKNNYSPDIQPNFQPQSYDVNKTFSLPHSTHPEVKPASQKVHWKVTQMVSIQEFISRTRSPENSDNLTKLHWQEAFNINKHKWYPMYKNQDISTHKYIQIGPGESVEIQSPEIKLWLKDLASLDLNGNNIDLHRGWMLVEGTLPINNHYFFKVHPELTPLTLTSHDKFAFIVSTDHLIVLKGYIKVHDAYHLHDQNTLKVETGSHLNLKNNQLNQLTARQLNQLLTQASMQQFIKAYQ